MGRNPITRRLEFVAQVGGDRGAGLLGLLLYGGAEDLALLLLRHDLVELYTDIEVQRYMDMDENVGYMFYTVDFTNCA